MSWKTPLPNWDSMAGRVLDGFFAAVHEALPTYALPITVFGSAPIQLCLDEDFASADVDIMVLSENERLREIAKAASPVQGTLVSARYGVQISGAAFFKPTPHYLQRAHTEVRYGLTIVVPHLRDILIGKLHRARFEGQQGLVSKDSRAVKRMRELCDGHPTREEVLEDLVQCEPYFRPNYDGGIPAFRFNVDDLLSEFYGYKLDLEKDILIPVMALGEGGDDVGKRAVRDFLDGLKPWRE